MIGKLKEQGRLRSIVGKLFVIIKANYERDKETSKRRRKNRFSSPNIRTYILTLIDRNIENKLKNR